jgi:ATP-dependent Lon protease
VDYTLDGFPNDFSGEVRLFPLPNLVLFPGCVQPLHIFESRYCEMLEDAMQDDRLIALATLQPGYEADYYGRPPIAAHVCVGRVVMHEPAPEETYNLILIGARRAIIEHEITPVRSFRRATVEILNDCTVTEANETARRLGAELAERFVAFAKSAEKLAINFGAGKITLSSLTDVVAFHFPLEQELKLQLLAEIDPIQRAHVLLGALDLLTPNSVAAPADSRPAQPSSAGRRPAFPPPFGDN